MGKCMVLKDAIVRVFINLIMESKTTYCFYIKTIDDAMDLNQLQIFAAIAEHQSFTKAAVQLKMDKSTVSTMLSKLESKFGAPAPNFDCNFPRLRGRSMTREANTHTQGREGGRVRKSERKLRQVGKVIQKLNKVKKVNTQGKTKTLKRLGIRPP